VTRSTYAPPATHGSLMLIHRLDRIARRRSEIALEPLGLRKRQVVALMILREHGAIAQGALGETLRLDPANLVGLLNELEDQGLLDRRRDPEDRRRHIVELTPKGIAALERAQEALAGVQDHVLAGLEDDERCALHELLVKAAQNHSAAEGFPAAAEPEACAEE
jgi:DNA-binding MarR family transcriptional regulator